jgi:hypothetical protein
MLDPVTTRPLVRSCQSLYPPSAYSLVESRIEKGPISGRINFQRLGYANRVQIVETGAMCGTGPLQLNVVVSGRAKSMGEWAARASATLRPAWKEGSSHGPDPMAPRPV